MIILAMLVVNTILILISKSLNPFLQWIAMYFEEKEKTKYFIRLNFEKNRKSNTFNSSVKYIYFFYLQVEFKLFEVAAVSQIIPSSSSL